MSLIDAGRPVSDGGMPSDTAPRARLAADEAGLWLAAIAESSREAIIGTDANGFVTFWNNVAETMFGYAPGEIIGQPIHCIIPVDRMDEETSVLDQIRRGVRVSRFETSRHHKNGTIIPVSVAIAPVRDQRNRIIGVLSIVSDLSEIRSVRRELEQREALLQQAHKMEAVGRLTAGVAHDFNNILQSIVNALELVLDDVAEDTPARKFTDIAIRAAVRATSLTNHMLSYAREQVLRPKVIELGPFLYDIQNLLARTMGSHNVIVRIQVTGSPSILADPGQLQTALLNLGINASHAMPSGGTLTMEASEESEGGRPWAVIGVIDTGVGMDETTLARAVEPFFTTKGADGSGLGLAMVQSFAEQAGGRLRITSVPGRGTTVRLRMPSAVPDHRDVSRKEAAKPRSHCRILLVDDSTDILSTLTALLARAGFEVAPADSGNQALAILAADGPFDVLMTDFAMPGMNGAELITRCRSVQPGLRTVVITGLTDLSFADTLPRGTGVLHKPVQSIELIETVHRLMRGDQDEACGTGAVASSHGSAAFAPETSIGIA
jgi:PAS domain S-box-containing protein